MAGAKKSFPLRLDPNIFDALERWSQDELRSVNAQIEYILREALRKAGRLPSPPRSASPSPPSESKTDE